LGSTALASFIYPVVKFLAPSIGKAVTKAIVLARNDLPVGEAKNIVFNDSPAIVINHSRRGILAFTRVCTHLGCLVEYDNKNNQLICPCHAGTFDLEGNVISGPPPKPLPKLPLRVEGDIITIG
jgi:cytochrome b6-f complex iron-sulfur subunit